MSARGLSLPDKSHLTIELSPSADDILKTLVKVSEASEVAVVSVSSTNGAVQGSLTYKVKSIDFKHQEEIGRVYGVPLKELEIFDFVISLGDGHYHITSLAIERTNYKELGKIRRFLKRTTPIQVLAVGIISVVGLLVAILTALLNLLLSLRQLVQP